LRRPSTAALLPRHVTRRGLLMLDVGWTPNPSFELLLAVQALEHAEQLVGVAGIEARTVVANEDTVCVALTGTAAISICGSVRAPVNFTALEIRSPAPGAATRGRRTPMVVDEYSCIVSVAAFVLDNPTTSRTNCSMSTAS